MKKMFSRSIPTFGKPNPRNKKPSTSKTVDANNAKYKVMDTCGLASKVEYAGDKPEENVNGMKTLSQQLEEKETTNKQLQSKIKSLQCSLKKKDALIGELNDVVQKSSEKNEVLTQELAHRNASLIELATLNNSLEKQIESKESEITEYEAKITKNEQIKTNLLKDIEYYKAELTIKINNVKERGDQSGIVDLKKKLEKAKHDYDILSRKFKEIKSEKEKSHVKLNEITCNLEELQKNHELAKVNLESAKSENKRLKLKNKKMQDELSAKTASGDGHEEHMKEIVKLNETNSAIMHNNKSFKAENSKLMNAIAALEQTNAQLMQDKETIAKHMDEIKTDNDLKSKLLDQANLQLATTNVQIQDLTQKLFESDRKSVHDSELNMYMNQVLDLENEMKHMNFDKNHIIDKLRLLQIDNDDLKLKLRGFIEKEASKPQAPTKSDKSSQADDIETETETACENCTLLKQELEKMGYANLRLNKEKATIKARFEKLALKTTKLDVKIERLENLITKDGPEEHFTMKTINDNQQKISYYMECSELNKKLERSENKFENLMSKFSQYERSKSRSSKITIIDELVENLSDSQLSLRTIEHKLNKEEGKLNSTLDRIKIVKEQLREGRLKLERDGGLRKSNLSSALLVTSATLQKPTSHNVSSQTCASEINDRKLNVFLDFHSLGALPMKKFQMFGNTRRCKTKPKLQEICEAPKSNKQYVSVGEYIDANEFTTQSITSDAKFDGKPKVKCFWDACTTYKNDDTLRCKMCLSRRDIDGKEMELSSAIVNFVNDLEICGFGNRLILMDKFENVLKMYGELAISAVNFGLEMSAAKLVSEDFERIISERKHIDKHPDVCATSKLNKENVFRLLSDVVFNVKCGVDKLNRTFENQRIQRLQVSFSYLLAIFYIIYFIVCNVIIGNDLNVESNIKFHAFHPKPIVMYLNHTLTSIQKRLPF